jgi:hypothetical protein
VRRAGLDIPWRSHSPSLYPSGGITVNVRSMARIMDMVKFRAIVMVMGGAIIRVRGIVDGMDL